MEESKPTLKQETTTSVATSKWARKRQVSYVLGILGVLVVLSIYPLFKIFYTPPSCFDNKQNQLEFGVDCGGPCESLCATQVVDIKLDWAESFLVSDGVYDLAASIQNSNYVAGIRELSYIFKVYDEKDFLIAEKTGTTFLKPRDKFIVFASGIRTNGKVPKEVIFEFEEDPVWVSMEAEEPSIMVKNKKLFNVSTSPRLNATLFNSSIDDLLDVEIVAVIQNNKGDPIAVSSTYEKRIDRNSSKDIFFTWPAPFTTKVKTGCTAPADVVLVFDRSGSMGFGGQIPPQPLTSAKNAALVFVDGMQSVDQVGLVSFATIASDPVDQPLTSLQVLVKEAIESIVILLPASEQHTNIGDGIEKATHELTSPRSNYRAKKAIVLLTDGVASRPLNPENETDQQHPEIYAKEKAQIAQDGDISIYVIGLGDSVNEEFLMEDIATTPNYYFKAATSAELKGIYDEIALAVCEEEMFVTEIVVHVKSTNGAR